MAFLRCFPVEVSVTNYTRWRRSSRDAPIVNCKKCENYSDCELRGDRSMFRIAYGTDVFDPFRASYYEASFRFERFKTRG